MVVEAVVEMTQGGADSSFEAIGLPLTAKQAFEMIRPGATTADVAGAWPDASYWGFGNEAEAFGLAFAHGLGVGLWERPMRDREFLRTGGAGAWDEHWVLNVMNPPIPVGDELWFFHQGGCQRVACRTSRDSSWWGSSARGQDFRWSSRLVSVCDMQRRWMPERDYGCWSTVMRATGASMARHAPFLICSSSSTLSPATSGRTGLNSIRW